jgi:hypothetical protein
MGVVPPLLLLISTVLFCKGLAPKTSLIRFFNLKNNLFADLCIPFLVPVMEVGHTAAYGGNANRAGGMTDLQKHVASFDNNGDGIISISKMYNGELLVCSPF